jgi:hypothetical protein
MEKVEDMDMAALAAGVPWDFETMTRARSLRSSRTRTW